MATKKFAITGLGPATTKDSVQVWLDGFGQVVGVEIIRDGNAAAPIVLSFIHNIIEISTTHFAHEKAIMLWRSHVTKEYEVLREAHDDVLHELNTIVRECVSLNAEGKTAECYRQLYRRTSNLFERNDRLFDSPI